MKSLQLLLPQSYIDDLIKHIDSAKKRVVIFTHLISYDESTHALIESLCRAAERNVQVEVAGDVYTFGILGAYSSLPLKPNKRIRRLYDMIRLLKKSGVHYHWIGHFGPFLFSGRTHVKWSIVDDRVYSFGGVNLYKQGLEANDYTLRGTDKTLADTLVAEHFRILSSNRKGSFYRSWNFDCDFGQVYVDGGLMFASAIYRRALELAEQSSDILFVSQYCPTGKLGDILKEKNAKIYFNHWRLADGLNRHLIRSSMKLTKTQTLYDRQVFLHAKFIIFSLSDGTKVALTGSHNFVWGGVVLGTREIALETTNSTIIAQLESFYKDYVA